jgi:hypothetical protein
VCVNGATETKELALVRFEVDGEKVVVERELI